MQVAGVIGIIVASICIDGLGFGFSQRFDTLLGVNVTAVNGWFIFLSLVEMIVQAVAITTFFVDIKLLKIKIPLGKSLWYLFNLIVSVDCVAFSNNYTILYNHKSRLAIRVLNYCRQH